MYGGKGAFLMPPGVKTRLDVFALEIRLTVIKIHFRQVVKMVEKTQRPRAERRVFGAKI